MATPCLTDRPGVNRSVSQAVRLAGQLLGPFHADQHGLLRDHPPAAISGSDPERLGMAARLAYPGSLEATGVAGASGAEGVHCRGRALQRRALVNGWLGGVG